ncbi:hypothetical protein HanPSC8_Chr08g0341451 [Helianthus annuus]|nr:hypothetical protein HanPSC8_Chr08g0341451 [Helianthus annuus]
MVQLPLCIVEEHTSSLAWRWGANFDFFVDCTPPTSLRSNLSFPRGMWETIFQKLLDAGSFLPLVEFLPNFHNFHPLYPTSCLPFLGLSPTFIGSNP